MRVQVQVGVRRPAVFVCVGVDAQLAAHDPAQQVGAEQHQHHADADLEPLRDRGRDRHAQRDHRERRHEQRRGMTETPQRADPRRLPERLLAIPAHDRADRDEVVGVERVAHSEPEAEAERGEQRGVHRVSRQSYPKRIERSSAIRRAHAQRCGGGREEAHGPAAADGLAVEHRIGFTATGCATRSSSGRSVIESV
jgi:hypothetical protein